MTLNPVLPPVLLVLLAATLVATRAAAWWRLTRGATSRSALWRWTGLSVAALLLMAAAMRPVLGATASAQDPADAREPNVFLVIDRSPEMAAPGPDGNSPAAQVNSDVTQLIDHYPKARFAVIGFASGPRLEWPLSADSWSLKPVVTAAATYAAPDAAATDAGAASTVLRYQLLSAAQQYPQAENLVYYLGAGTPKGRTPQGEFELPDNSVAGGAVLGYGSDGIPSLQSVAEQIGVQYVQRTGPSIPTEALAEPPAPVQQDTRRASSGTELYWALTGPAAILILIELYLVLREVARTRLDRVRL